MIGHDEINQRLGYHPGTNTTKPKHEDIRDSYISLAVFVDTAIPDGREKSLALTALQESMMWANAAVARTAPLEK